MKKIVVVIMMLLVIPLMTVEKINNKNYYLETETNTYTKEEIDNKINELLTKINDNTTKITETKSILTEIKNKLDDYALKTALTKTNEDITALDELANQNKARIDELEKTSTSITPTSLGMNNTAFEIFSKSKSSGTAGITSNSVYSGTGNDTNDSNNSYFASLEKYNLSNYNTLLLFSGSFEGWNSFESSIAFGGCKIVLIDGDNKVINVTNQTNYNAILVDITQYQGEYRIGFYISSGSGTTGYGQRYSRITNGGIRLS